MRIEIGSKPLKELISDNLLAIAKIEGVHLALEYWGDLKLLDFSNSLFSDTYVIDFFQERIDDGFIGKTIIFFFNFKDFSFHWHFEGEQDRSRASKRISLETIKYLIKEGFDLPLY